jgi:penicillin-binding protein 1A
MEAALKDEPPIPFRVPPGIHQVLINAHTGTRALSVSKDTIWEAFVEGTEPTDSNAYILDDTGMKNAPDLGPMPEETGADITDNGYGSGYGYAPPAPPTPADNAVTGTGGFY